MRVARGTAVLVFSVTCLVFSPLCIVFPTRAVHCRSQQLQTTKFSGASCWASPRHVHRRPLVALQVSRDAQPPWRPILPPQEGDGSGAVVASILETAVRLLLRSYDQVRVDVQSRLANLLQGRVDTVFLLGKGWRTKLHLTTRELVVVATNGVHLNYWELLSGRVTLTKPAVGEAEVVFDATDFGNLLVYPQVSCRAPQIAGQPLAFVREGVVIEGSSHRVLLNVSLSEHSVRLSLSYNPAGMVVVTVIDSPPSANHLHAELEDTLPHFFETLHLDLAGIELSFAAMRFDLADEGSEIVRLRLQAVIRRIPNPLLDQI